MSAAYTLGGLTAEPGTQVRGRCEVSLGEATVSLPVAITHGRQPGPVLAVTAGIHGGEYVPMIAVRQFVRELDPAELSGTVVASLQSSPVAFERRAAFVNPLDGQNLNRSFPGDPGGGPTARLAAWLWENVLSRADYYVDCHCGDLPEVLEPFTSISSVGDETVRSRSRDLADCFDVTHLIVSGLAGATVTEVSRVGIPAVLVEIGGLGRWTQAEADVQKHGLRRVAARAGILPPAGGVAGDTAGHTAGVTAGHTAGDMARPRLPVFEDAADLLSDRAGLWFPEVAVGAPVAAGTRLGRLEDVFGDEVQEIIAPVAGVLSFGLGSLAAAKGDLLASIARPVG